MEVKGPYLYRHGEVLAVLSAIPQTVKQIAGKLGRSTEWVQQRLSLAYTEGLADCEEWLDDDGYLRRHWTLVERLDG